MTRKHVVIVFSLLIGVAAGIGGTLWSLFQAPAFYATAMQRDVPAPERKELAKRFVQNTMQLVDGIKNEPHWSEEFSEAQVNGWLSEELHQKYSKWLPAGVKEPRVQFGPDSLELAFQFQKGIWSGVISARLKAWVSKPNQLAIEIQSIKAGLIPIPLDDLVAEISKELHAVGWRIECKRTASNDVLVVHFGTDEVDESVLELVQLQSRMLRISGSRKSPRSMAEFRSLELPFRPYESIRDYGVKSAHATVKQ